MTLTQNSQNDCGHHYSTSHVQTSDDFTTTVPHKQAMNLQNALE
jgi:hypothetical protein